MTNKTDLRDGTLIPKFMAMLRKACHPNDTKLHGEAIVTFQEQLERRITGVEGFVLQDGTLGLGDELSRFLTLHELLFDCVNQPARVFQPHEREAFNELCCIGRELELAANYLEIIFEAYGAADVPPYGEGKSQDSNTNEKAKANENMKSRQKHKKGKKK